MTDFVDVNEHPKVVETDSAWTGTQVAEHIQVAVNIERKRCAKVAEEFLAAEDRGTGQDLRYLGRQVAAKIRSGAAPDGTVLCRCGTAYVIAEPPGLICKACHERQAK